MSQAKNDKQYVYTSMCSPVGRLKLVASSRGLAAILWENDDPKRVRLNIVAEDRNHPVLRETERQLGEYFDGRRRKFTVTLDFEGTPFQKDVWKALLAIPFGETRSYGQIARELGNPQAVRAVGAANGKNPISIIAPCHRVIGSTGKLTGFAGGLKPRPICWSWKVVRPTFFAGPPPSQLRNPPARIDWAIASWPKACADPAMHRFSNGGKLSPVRPGKGNEHGSRPARVERSRFHRGPCAWRSCRRRHAAGP